ncbi:GNAT family N-acetyltransferase [Shewanella baltica]|uniref:GNAT family N-acetyltransferase n=1 Tax=Shewanella baltica TaxID=62322 RepID=UPI00217EE0EF|nr:GNAT family N-acetyltransferase [Shewanella baltica]MCS6097797.1 GNAT family N-acetyltransferase [Shewanella baltica]MCS6099182.1 GNAT family N-acetyltransferase [Shewanella baltica]MCS6117737.1 GNAT family N-acetyltransferase [Shewanella baltica]MCS6182751.1 GNAT family N-acetyltransferase [Shewanella baltica]MCS6225303.1 GNAT family N-acetyltransferase [Shewanella baltica]
MNTLKIEYTENLSDEANDKMTAGHEKYEHENGIEINYKNFAFTLSDQNGEIFGILNAYTAYSEIYIEDLWVNESLRRMGHGKQLVQALENHFKGKGYNNINLVTNEFQSPDFYKKCGYDVEFIRINKENNKLTKTFLIKYF